MNKKPLEEIEKALLKGILFYQNKGVRSTKIDICATVDLGEKFWSVSNEKIWKMIDRLRRRGFLETRAGKWIAVTATGVEAVEQ